MVASDEIIKVLEYLCSKIGLTIDWTNKNIFPYIEQLCGKFIRWEIATSTVWIVIAVVALVVAYFAKKHWLPMMKNIYGLGIPCFMSLSLLHQLSSARNCLILSNATHSQKKPFMISCKT